MNVNFNILNQKGAPAVYEDSLANRPAASFAGRLFVDTDIISTGIYRDTGTSWELIAAGGGGGTNIYNSDGTLTGNRQLSGNNNNLTFSDLNVFKTTFGSNDIGLRLDFANGIYYLGSENPSFGVKVNYGLGTNRVFLGDEAVDFNGTGFELNDILQFIQTANQGNVIGLTLDFANDSYTLGDPLSFTGAKYFTIDNANGIIATGDNVGVNGFKLDLNNSINQFGFISTTNSTQLYIDDTNQIIKTNVGGTNIGLKLDFVNDEYIFGNPDNSINRVYLQLNPNEIFFGYGFTKPNEDVLYHNALTGIYQYGAITKNQRTQFFINAINQIIKTTNQNNDIGLKLDFANREYNFGEFTTNNRTNLSINDTNQRIQTFNNSAANGLDLNFPAAQRRFWFGDYAVNFCFLRVDSTTTNQSIAGYSNGLSDNGFLCDFTNKIYRYGDFQNNGGSITFNQFNCILNYNTTLQLTGTSIITGSAGGNSGQHLKVKINNVDYVIKLENP
jgi:hypothetical protein